MPKTTRKAFAYITHRDRLLVFVHPLQPEAGIQVPAGTLEPGEDPASGAMREAAEETGLVGLELVRFLGERRHRRGASDQDEIHHRYFFHLRYPGEPPEQWRHGEFDPSDGSALVIPFDFYWVRLPDEVPELIADHGALLPALIESLSIGL